MKFSSQPWMIDVRKLETNLRAIVCTFTQHIEVIQPKSASIRFLKGIPEAMCGLWPLGRKYIVSNMQEAARVSREQRTVLFV